jgi:Emfourin
VDDPTPPGLVVRVARSGGFAGQTKEGAVDLDSTDPRAAAARRLIQRIDLRAVAPGEPRPHRYVYRFSYLGTECLVHEPALTADLAELARVVLGD